jgi:hypothetical protein
MVAHAQTLSRTARTKKRNSAVYRTYSYARPALHTVARNDLARVERVPDLLADLLLGELQCKSNKLSTQDRNPSHGMRCEGTDYCLQHNPTPLSPHRTAPDPWDGHAT